MTRTGFLEKGKYPSNFAYTFSYDTEDKKETDPLFYIENFYAAGCMYSTAEDLLKLDQAMYGDELLSEKSKELDVQILSGIQLFRIQCMDIQLPICYIKAKNYGKKGWHFRS